MVLFGQTFTDETGERVPPTDPGPITVAMIRQAVLDMQEFRLQPIVVSPVIYEKVYKPLFEHKRGGLIDTVLRSYGYVPSSRADDPQADDRHEDPDDESEGT